MKQLFVTCILFCLGCTCATAQNLTGRWQWTIMGSEKDVQSDYLIELDLRQEGNRIYGLRTLYLKNFDDMVVNVEGQISANGEVIINSKNVMQCHIPDSILIAKDFTYKMYIVTGNNNRMNGIFYPREDTSKLQYKISNPDLYYSIFAQPFSSPFRKLSDTLSAKARQRMGMPEVAKATPPLVVDVQSRLTLPATDVSIDLYDNGDIDGDTITLLVNNKEVASNKRLSTHAIHFDLKQADFADTTTIVMKAENLGSIPPNTALMLITAAGKRYDIRLSSDLKRQAGVVLFKQH